MKVNNDVVSNEENFIREKSLPYQLNRIMSSYEDSDHRNVTVIFQKD